MYSVSNKQLQIGIFIASLSSWGCEQAPTLIDTEIAFQLPMNDTEAAEKLSRILVEAWPASKGVCAEFADWRQVVCNGNKDASCPKDIDLDRRVEGEPRHRMEFKKNGDLWDFSPIDLGTRQNVQISIRGYDADGQGIVYGCRALELGERTVIALARPWCNQAVCLETFHAACGAKIECGLQGANSSTASQDPVCKASISSVFVWEQDGEPCASIPNIFRVDGGEEEARCQQAIVVCEPGMTEPVRDGICPAEEEACLDGASYPEDDLDCDGVAPVSSCACQPGETIECDSGGDCMAYADCLDNFQYGECATATVSVPETCDGIDSNCNRIIDTDEPEALQDCLQQIGSGGIPVADNCGTGVALNPDTTRKPTISCLCGSAPACTKRGSGCCEEVCVVVATSEQHCGSCNVSCKPYEQCCGGQCLDLRTNPTNCGSCGNQCDRTDSTCCDGNCVDTSTNTSHCGACKIACADDESCCGTDGCIDISSDRINCGGCGVQCLRDEPHCIAGECKCRDSSSCINGQDCCSGDCTDLSIDPNNCGNCGSVCATAHACVNGRCVILAPSRDAGVNKDAALQGNIVRFDSGI